MSTEKRTAVEFGQTVYAEDGTRLGTVCGFDEAGFYRRSRPSASGSYGNL